MKKIILTIIVTLAIFVAGFLIYITSGSYDISQTVPHNGLTKWVIRKTTHSSIDKRMMENQIPSNFNDSTQIMLGFQHYDEMCTSCHGAPGIKPWEMAEGLYPEPPQMFKRKKQEDPQEFFWIIKNGIKMTSMPAYGPTHDDKTLWAITAFVTEKLNKMSPQEYIEWVRRFEAKKTSDID
jgi:hypothetical protein